MIYKFVAMFLCIGLMSCGPKKPDLKTLDLLQYGVPITVLAPDSAQVVVDDLGFWKDITIMQGDDYNIQIIASDATSLDIKKIVSEKLQEVKDEAYFSKIIVENEDGFIYEKQIDENTIDYDFRYIKVQGNTEYIFQTGLMGMYTEQEVRNMYDSVK